MHCFAKDLRNSFLKSFISLLVLCALFFFSINMAYSQKRVVPQNKAAVQYSFAPVVKKASPAVVNVYVRKQVRKRVSPFLDDPFFRRFFGRGQGRLPRDRMQSSLGSGVIVSADGVVVTNFHVIKNAGANNARDGDSNIKVALADKREFSAKLVLKDERTDLAILKIIAPGTRFNFLDIEDSDSLEVGDFVLAIGNPFGVGQTVTSGIVSALARTRIGISDFQFFIQTDAAINPGNSGGALVDVNGKLVGINTAIFSRSGESNGIGFAIPSNMVRLVVESAISGRSVKRPWFGAKLQTVTSEIAESFGLDRPAGALLSYVLKNGPAQRAGLKVGDVIVGVDGKPVADPRAFRYRFATKGLNKKVVLDIIRAGRIEQIAMTTIGAPETTPRKTTWLSQGSPFSGAQIANLSPALAEELSLEDTSGVVVQDVRNSSSARSIGLRPGDIIMRINGKSVKSVKDLQTILKRKYPDWRFLIKRDGRILSTRIRS
ncbi:MAG: DegQ family serine endoprotease [Pseudomonadota bacterium]